MSGSASQRSLARLPLSVFVSLTTPSSPKDFAADGNPPSNAALELRWQIVAKLAAASTSAQKNKKRRRSGYSDNVAEEPITTVGQLLQMSPSALLRAVDPLLTDAECRLLIDRVCQICAPLPRSALSLLPRSGRNSGSGTGSGVANCRSNYHDKTNDASSSTHLSSGMPLLDRNLRGGFRIGSITEVVGRAGVGKTQLVMQLCVEAARTGRGSVYIDTERKISLRRMKEIAQERRAMVLHRRQMQQQPLQQKNGNSASGDSGMGGSNDGIFPSGTANDELLDYRHPMDVLENVTVHSPRSTQELMDLISEVDEEILQRNEEAEGGEIYDTKTVPPQQDHRRRHLPVGLLVLDSIAAPTRRDFSSDSAIARVNAVFKIAQALKRIADQLNIAVVVVNQVGNLDEYGQGSAALGVSWHHCVSTRLMLDYQCDPHKMGAGGMDEAYDDTVSHVRTARIVKSNECPNSTVSFEIDTTGIVLLQDNNS